MNKDYQKLLEIAADSLQGTAKPVSEAAEQFGVLEDDLSEHIATEGEIELCQTCGWWCEISDLDEDENGENICIDCQ